MSQGDLLVCDVIGRYGICVVLPTDACEMSTRLCSPLEYGELYVFCECSQHNILNIDIKAPRQYRQTMWFVGCMEMEIERS